MNKPTVFTILVSVALSAILSVGINIYALKSDRFDSKPPAGEAASDYVKQALLADPAMLEDVFAALQKQREQQQTQNVLAALENAQPALYSDTRDPVLGNPEAKFTIVEFFDYNCGYCKISAKWMKEKFAQHPDDIRIIFKDFPVLEGRAEGSKEASSASLAVWKQGAQVFHNFHFAMMEAKGGYDSQRIDEIAAASGVNVTQMRADMTADEAQFEAHMSDIYNLASSLEINGTPAFVADGVLVHGADTQQLQQLLDQKLAET
ncbi:MAG: DsbA family protein [Robiginitomaculum sp.]|nr:DsbA family protein [Robiginitomaculum sp.]